MSDGLDYWKINKGWEKADRVRWTVTTTTHTLEVKSLGGKYASIEVMVRGPQLTCVRTVFSVSSKLPKSVSSIYQRWIIVGPCTIEIDTPRGWEPERYAKGLVGKDNNEAG